MSLAEIARAVALCARARAHPAAARIVMEWGGAIQDDWACGPNAIKSASPAPGGSFDEDVLEEVENAARELGLVPAPRARRGFIRLPSSIRSQGMPRVRKRYYMRKWALAREDV